MRKLLIVVFSIIAFCPQYSAAIEIFPDHEYRNYEFEVKDDNYTIQLDSSYRYPFNPIFADIGLYFTDDSSGECGHAAYEKILQGVLVRGSVWLKICSISDHAQIYHQSGYSDIPPQKYNQSIILFGNYEFPTNQIIGFDYVRNTLSFAIDLPGRGGHAVAIEISPDRNFVGISSDTCIHVVDVHSRNVVLWETEMQGYCTGIWSKALAFTPDSSTFISHDENAKIAGWSTDSWVKFGNSSQNFELATDFLVEEIVISNDNLTAFFYTECYKASGCDYWGDGGRAAHPHSLYKSNLGNVEGFWASSPERHYFGTGINSTNPNIFSFAEITNRQVSGQRFCDGQPREYDFYLNQNQFVFNSMIHLESLNVFMIDMRFGDGDCYHHIQFNNGGDDIDEAFVFLDYQGNLLQSLNLKCTDHNSDSWSVGDAPRLVGDEVWINPCGAGGFLIDFSLLDTDRDGIPNRDDPDDDNDGLIDSLEPDKWASITPDVDQDGILDGDDAFPFDSSEWRDLDKDGCGDNSDKFPNDPNECYDSDNDGYGDSSDKFLSNPNEWLDSDNDGVGDNSDAFPINGEEWIDSDRDGVGDNSDVFPNDADESMDSDGDGVGDNADAYPLDSMRSTTTDETKFSSNLMTMLGFVLVSVSILLFVRQKRRSKEHDFLQNSDDSVAESAVQLDESMPVISALHEILPNKAPRQSQIPDFSQIGEPHEGGYEVIEHPMGSDKWWWKDEENQCWVSWE
jgi:hypothetical protein